MKKLWTLLLSVCAVALLVSGNCLADRLDAKSYVETLCSGDADSLAEDYTHTKELLDALKPSGGFVGLPGCDEGSGNFVRSGNN